MRIENARYVVFLTIFDHFDLETWLFALKVALEKIIVETLNRSKNFSRSRRNFSDTSYDAPRCPLSNTHQYVKIRCQTIKYGPKTHATSFFEHIWPFWPWNVTFCLKMVLEKIIVETLNRSKKFFRNRRNVSDTSHDAPRSSLSIAHRFVKIRCQTIKCGTKTHATSFFWPYLTILTLKRDFLPWKRR
jgi:hypothetical protein